MLAAGDRVNRPVSGNPAPDGARLPGGAGTLARGGLSGAGRQPRNMAYRGTTQHGLTRLLVTGAPCRCAAGRARPAAGRTPSGGECVPQLTRQDFEHLLAFRASLRRFQRWSEDQARAAGLTHVQHQLLIAVKGHPGDEPPTVSDLAGYLLLRHHSAVELVDRAEAAGFVRRIADAGDGRLVRVRLTARGERCLSELTPAHLVELHSLAAVLDELVAGADA